MIRHRLRPLLVASLLLSCLAGCGKALPVASADPALIDSGFNHLPAPDAKQRVGQQRQDQADHQTRQPETSQVGAPGGTHG